MGDIPNIVCVVVANVRPQLASLSFTHGYHSNIACAPHHISVCSIYFSSVLALVLKKRKQQYTCMTLKIQESLFVESIANKYSAISGPLMYSS